MAVAAPQRVGQRAFLGGLLAATALMSLVVGTVVILGGGADCPAMGSTPTDQAKNSIPAAALVVYQRAGQRYDVDWAFLASIGAHRAVGPRTRPVATARGALLTGCWLRGN